VEGVLHGGIICDVADAAMGIARVHPRRWRGLHDARPEDQLRAAVLDRHPHRYRAWWRAGARSDSSIATWRTL